MEPFSTIVGQNQARNLLLAAVRSGRLAHAYILAGPQGSGRLTAAMDLAGIHMCREVEDGFCGECRHCKQIATFTHPDVRFTIPTLKTTTPENLAKLFATRAADGITPLQIAGNSYISIEQIRVLEQRLSRKSFEGRGYVEIILGAHLMRREAANAMLKTLEEPPDNTLIILITSRLNGLLPTVRSRAHTIRFGRVSSKIIKKVLIDRGIDSERAEKLALVSDGRPGRALELSRADQSDNSVALELFSKIISGSTDVMELAACASDTARKLGREGILDLCTQLTILAHDARRQVHGSGPLASSELPDSGSFDDSMLENTVSSMQLCIERLRANVSPAMAFAAALASASETDGNNNEFR